MHLVDEVRMMTCSKCLQTGGCVQLQNAHFELQISIYPFLLLVTCAEVNIYMPYL